MTLLEQFICHDARIHTPINNSYSHSIVWIHPSLTCKQLYKQNVSPSLSHKLKYHMLWSKFVVSGNSTKSMHALMFLMPMQSWPINRSTILFFMMSIAFQYSIHFIHTSPLLIMQSLMSSLSNHNFVFKNLDIPLAIFQFGFFMMPPQRNVLTLCTKYRASRWVDRQWNNWKGALQIEKN